jgi:archaeal flagellin N-terminal-like domain
MSSHKNNDNGFTGLEAAIVLIAFVVVAAVFSYVVLGAGFFTTQKAQETVHTSVQQTTSAVELSGPVSVESNDAGTGVSNVTFYLQLAAGGNGVDMSKVTYTLATGEQMTSYSNSTVHYLWVKQNEPVDLGQTENSGLLNSREMVLVRIVPDFNIGVNTKFIVEVKPPIGAALPISRTVPAGMTANKWYDVY